MVLEKCERCPWQDTCKVRANGNCLPDLTDDYPEWWKIYHKGKSIDRLVDVDLIVGGFQSVRRDSFTPDFQLRTPDERWLSVNEGVTESGVDLSRMGWPHNPIQLIGFEGKFYVGNDGHRRISVAKIHKIKELKALVTPLVPFRESKKKINKEKVKEVLGEQVDN